SQRSRGVRGGPPQWAVSQGRGTTEGRGGAQTAGPARPQARAAEPGSSADGPGLPVARRIGALPRRTGRADQTEESRLTSAGANALRCGLGGTGTRRAGDRGGPRSDQAGTLAEAQRGSGEEDAPGPAAALRAAARRPALCRPVAGV